MTTPASSQPSAPGATSVVAPIGVRIASTLCWIVGILTIVVSVAVGIPAISAGGSPFFVAVNLVAGGAVCLAAVLIRRRRRLGVVAMILELAWPTLVLVATAQCARRSF